MDPRDDPSVLPHGHSAKPHPPSADARLQISMDDNTYYQRIMTFRPRRPSQPPPYQVDDPIQRHTRDHEPEPSAPAPSSAAAPAIDKGKSKGKGKAAIAPAAPTSGTSPDNQEPLPEYSSSIDLEGIFMRKHEIEETTKRAEDRRWHTTFATLTGTALNFYKVKKNRSWGRTPRDGPTISPDNPPWMRKGKLEKSYSLLYADAGIAADYKKRRYVIRLRAETDQFLLSCIELSTFNKWLEALFAAIDLALPIDDRDFPRDMSIPRVQRVRWYRRASPIRAPERLPDALVEEGQVEGQEDEAQEAGPAEPSERPTPRRPSTSPDPLPSLYRTGSNPRPGRLTTTNDDARGMAMTVPVFEDDDGDLSDGSEVVDESDDDDGTPPPRLDPAHRLSMSTYPNAGVDPHSGKWVPEHRWSSAHDMLYAKLCYSNLLFRSPRKSNFIIRQGKKWFVDWATGRMVRVLPPAYGEVDFFGPWQVVHTENLRI